MPNRRRKGRRTFGATRQLPSGRWQASYLAPDGTRKKADQTFAEAADANAWLTSVESEVLRGDWRPPEPARETFGDYGRRWLANRPDLRPSSAERYERLWRIWLEPTFGVIPLGKMTPESWRTWFTRSCATHPGSTQPGAAYRLGRAILNTAVEDGMIRANPARVKGAGREQAPERPVAAPDEVLNIVKRIDQRYEPMVLLAAWCSLRFGELAGLRRSRIDLLHRTIRVEENGVELSSGKVVFGSPKTDAGRRTVSVPAELIPSIERHLATYVGPQVDALVFTSPEGHPLRRTKFRNRWIVACEAAGVTGLHFHDLRGSGATWAAHGGATVAELMARLGHTTPNMAMRYQHATQERDAALAAKLGALFSAAESQSETPAGIRPVG
jgi:integrase